MLSEYVRDKKRRKVGLVIAHKDEEGKILIGWSLYNKKAEEKEGVKFNRGEAWQKAITRLTHVVSLPSVPFKAINTIYSMVNRSTRYYKDGYPTILDPNKS